MDRDKEIVDFYEFWKWQYTKRNPSVYTPALELKNISEKLHSDGLLTEPRAAIMALKRLAPDYPGRNQLWLVGVRRTPTPEEIEELVQVDALASEVERSGYFYEAITDLEIDANRIIGTIVDGNNLFDLAPESIFYGVHSCICHTGCMDLNDGTIGRPNFSSDISKVHMFHIDINAQDQYIISELLNEIHFLRCLEAGRVDWGTSCKDACPQFETCSSAHIDLRNSGRRALYLARPGVSFNPDKPASRAIGLWLWDYVQEHGGEKKRGVIAAAIRSMKDQLGHEIKALGLATSEERVFRGLHRRTAECIEACEVLSFK